MARTTRARHLLVALLALRAASARLQQRRRRARTPTTSGEQTDEAAGDDDGGEEPSGDGLLAEVRDRGTLNCGVNNAVPGFGVVDDAGEFSGFDIDFCRVIAAAVLGDAEAVEYVPLTAEQRFTSLAAGEIDVLVRNTTRTASRDGTENAAFAATTFYDGQGMMVPADSGIAWARRHGRRHRVRALGHHHGAEPRHRVQRTRPELRAADASTRSTRSGRPSSRVSATAGRPTARSSPACARPGRTPRAGPTGS